MAFTLSRTATFFTVFLLLGCTPTLQSVDRATPAASITLPPVSPEPSPKDPDIVPKTVVSAQRLSAKPPLANPKLPHLLGENQAAIDRNIGKPNFPIQ
jgi:hypothetical protein